MNILIIQGPNLNLIGLKSVKIGENVTLDKVNKGLRKQANKSPEEITLKILQSHKIEKAMSSIHRNRNWANGIIIAPMAWARYEYSLKECLHAVSLPIYEVFLNPNTSLKEIRNRQLSVQFVLKHCVVIHYLYLLMH